MVVMALPPSLSGSQALTPLIIIIMNTDSEFDKPFKSERSITTDEKLHGLMAGPLWKAVAVIV